MTTRDGGRVTKVNLLISDEDIALLLASTFAGQNDKRYHAVKVRAGPSARNIIEHAKALNSSDTQPPSLQTCKTN